jgi:hypothetical protein
LRQWDSILRYDAVGLDTSDGDVGINRALQAKVPTLTAAIDLKGERLDWESICYKEDGVRVWRPRIL